MRQWRFLLQCDSADCRALHVFPGGSLRDHRGLLVPVVLVRPERSGAMARQASRRSRITCSSAGLRTKNLRARETGRCDRQNHIGLAGFANGLNSLARKVTGRPLRLGGTEVALGMS
jgi:hypothetical protein